MIAFGEFGDGSGTKNALAENLRSAFLNGVRPYALLP
tara:strand:- start:365 stop:475 length:111 start_codon:yes stop_codon:yes gene_type:complete